MYIKVFYGLGIGDEFSWELLLHCGYALLERLQSLAANTNVGYQTAFHGLKCRPLLSF